MPQQRLVIPSSRSHRPKYFQTLRAMWHDTQALFKEFRRPLMVFLFSVFVGGYAYMVLNNQLTDNPKLEYIDMPYIMSALMILESTIDLPTEPFLIVFWYLQPLVAVYVVGRGATDFIRLFFNRNQRRDAWEVAVVSTYRRHVIVIGVGHVGTRVTRTLIDMGFQVAVVDISIDKELDDALTELGVPAIIGDGRQIATLEQAGLEYATACIVCTSNDHANLEMTMRVRDMNPDIRIVARMWDDRLAQQMQRFFNVTVLSASDLAAPAFAGSAMGLEITQTLHIAGIEYSMIKLKVREGSFMDGKTVDVLQEDENTDIVLLQRHANEPEVHPAGNEIVNAGDTLVMFAKHTKIMDIVQRNEIQRRK